MVGTSHPSQLFAADAVISTYSHADLSDWRHADGFPKIVFQTWKSRDDLPDHYRYWRSTFIRMNPDYRVVLWDDNDNRSFIQSHFSWFLTKYDSYPGEIYRVDIVRLFFLFEYGGLYADMDSECIRPISDIPANGSVVLGRLGDDPDFEHSIPNAIMLSKPRQIFWLLAIANAIERLDAFTRGLPLEKPEVRRKSHVLTSGEGPEFMTGPILIKDTADMYMRSDPASIEARIALYIPAPLVEIAKGGELSLLPKQYFYAFSWIDPLHRIFRDVAALEKSVLRPEQARKIFADACIVTYWSHSWSGLSMGVGRRRFIQAYLRLSRLLLMPRKRSS